MYTGGNIAGVKNGGITRASLRFDILQCDISQEIDEEEHITKYGPHMQEWKSNKLIAYQNHNNLN